MSTYLLDTTLVIVGTNDKATITLTYAGPQGGQATDSFTFALTNDTTVVAWIDPIPIQPDPNLLGPQDPVYQDLTDPLACAIRLKSWQIQGQNGYGQANNGLFNDERVFADHFLNAGSGNLPPPGSRGRPGNPNDPSYISSQDYRMYQRLQAYYEVVNGPSGWTINPGTIAYLNHNAPYLPTAGVTPEPCTGFQILKLPVETNAMSGSFGLSSDGTLVYQVVETRVGSNGQAVNQFLNGPVGGDYRTATPWIWDVIQFDANGKTQAWVQGTNSSNVQIFPTYEVYTNGSFYTEKPEGDLMTFIGLNSTSQYSGPHQ